MGTTLRAACLLSLFWIVPACGDNDDGGSPSEEGGGAATAGTGGRSPTAGRGGNSSNPGGGSSLAGDGGREAQAGDGGVDAGGEGGGGGEAGAAAEPVDCGLVAKAPASFEVLSGFTRSEDFAFDALGNYVGVDDDGNLVRVSKAGKKELWAAGLPTTAGIQMLKDGSAVIADVTNGAVIRVYPNGARKVLLGGLLYPNGLDVGPDGFIYVAENSGGRVRRVDPETGDFSVVALGLQGPNGIAFGDDAGLMYVGSFEGSGVYKVELEKPGTLGRASIFAKPHGSMLAEPMLACPEQVVGKACTTATSETGTCERLANVVDCFARNPCAGAMDGAACQVDGSSGECSGGFCVPSGPCGGEVCEPPEACAGKAAGDACTEGQASGTCVDTDGYLWCQLPGPCEGKQNGAVCGADPAPGTCHDDVCVPDACGPDCATSCSQETLGKNCYVDAVLGKCTETPDGIACFADDPNGEHPGGIDGLGVDACGNVYASEFSHGIVWRVSPSGVIERLVDLPSSWIPNIKWGRGIGGFERGTMYVADRDESRLFAVSVGVPGAREHYEAR